MSGSKQPNPYIELTKPRLTSMAVMTAILGFFLGSSVSLDIAKLLYTALGTLLVGASCGVLNQYMERELDARMARTALRPIPSGQVAPLTALRLGVALGVAGLLVLSVGVHLLSGSLAVLTIVSYLFWYTPLKQKSTVCTLVGAIPGALPPLIGWAGATNSLSLGGWLLFGILFLWQMPHFLSLAWEFRKDYAQAGHQMLPVIDPEGTLTFKQIELYSLSLLVVSLLPTVIGLVGQIYFWSALGLGVFFTWKAFVLDKQKTEKSAHQFFLTSILYLPVLLIIMALNKVNL